MTPFEVYADYVALKRHFTTKSYDYFKYNGKTNANVGSFKTRPDKLFFEKLSKHENPHNFLLSNLIHDENSWIGNLSYSSEAENVYKEWLKTQQSLSQVFKSQLNFLEDDFDRNFECVNHQHPPLLMKYLKKDISFDVLCLLLKITKAKKTWDKELKGDYVWEPISNKVDKYIRFLKFDEEKLINICLDKFPLN